MIAKCIAILAIVGQISASGCGQCSVVLNSCGSGCSSGSFSSGVTRNIIVKGKYPVALNNCGPSPDQQIPITTSSITAPVQERTTVQLPGCIPDPKTISHTCTCFKTILRPRVHQQVITVPTIQRYIETSHKPVIENIQYEAVPVNYEGCSSGSSSGSSQIQVVEAPRVQVVEAQRVQAVEVPRVQVVELPRVQAVQIPRVQAVQIPRVQAVQIPSVQTVEIPTCGMC